MFLNFHNIVAIQLAINILPLFLILDLSIFRRDQIWFTELTTDNRSTDLYSLAEIKNVRKDENIGKGYIAGKYGAIPMLNANLAGAIEKEG